MLSKYLGVRGGTLSDGERSRASAASRGRVEPESKGQHNLTVSRLEVHSRPLLDVKHGANLLWDDNLAFRPDDS